MRGARRASRQKGAASQTLLGLAEPLGFFTAAVRVSVSSGRRRRATTAVGTFNHHQDLTVRLYRSAEPDPQPQTPSISWVARGLAPGPPGRARPRAASGARPPARSASASSRTASPSRSPPTDHSSPTPPTAPSRAAPPPSRAPACGDEPREPARPASASTRASAAGVLRTVEQLDNVVAGGLRVLANHRRFDDRARRANPGLGGGGLGGAGAAARRGGN